MRINICSLALICQFFHLITDTQNRAVYYHKVLQYRYPFPVFGKWHDNQTVRCTFRSFRFLYLRGRYDNAHLYCGCWSRRYESDTWVKVLNLIHKNKTMHLLVNDINHYNFGIILFVTNSSLAKCDIDIDLTERILINF